ncbi:unnamed protein product [Urochloa decumbens]|uniref:Uncharacterized protein n=1 Tax=Urochloa decumbens TaxID=240449 RepID=A0ABC8W7Y3_9POAL
MADEPSDACSRTDGDGVRAGRNNKRKSSQACSYPNKRERFIIRNARERYVISVFAAVVCVLIYVFTEYDDEEEEEDEDDESHAELLKVTVDCFIAAKAWAELKLGTENANIKQILGMLRFLPGYDEAVKARQEAVKAK